MSLLKRILDLLRRKPREPDNLLDRKILALTGEDALSMRQLLDGGVFICGRPGSGKTSSSGKAVATAAVNYPGCGGIICASAPTDYAMWRAIFDRAGNGKRLIPFGPRHPHRFNLCEYLSDVLDFDAKDLAKAIITVGEALDNDDSRAGGGEGDKFWAIGTKTFLESAIILIKLAYGPVTMEAIEKFVSTAPAQAADIDHAG
jgi:hypothetical protein